MTVIRKVDPAGSVSFAGSDTGVGNAYRRKNVEVTLLGDTVQIFFEGGPKRSVRRPRAAGE